MRYLTCPLLNDLVLSHILGTVDPLLVVKSELHVIHKLARIRAELAVIPEVWDKHIRDPNTVVPGERHE